MTETVFIRSIVDPSPDGDGVVLGGFHRRSTSDGRDPVHEYFNKHGEDLPDPLSAEQLDQVRRLMRSQGPGVCVRHGERGAFIEIPLVRADV